MKLGILLLENHRLLSIAAMLDVFETVNSFYEEEGKPHPFTIELICWEANNSDYAGYVPKPAHNEERYDLIFIPAFKNMLISESIELNKPWIPWLQQQYKKGAAIASYCTGAFLLAATGLLNDKPATTHINAWASFARLFPKVQVQERAVVTEQDRIYTSGGSTNSFHLMMLLLEIYCSREIAVRTAKVFSVDMDRNCQLYFGSFVPVHNHGDELVKQAQDEIKKNFSTAATIEEIITEVPASRRNLARRFKQVTGITPIEYLQKTRIEAAKQLLETSKHSIMEVMLESGYNDLKTFRSLFKRNVGMTPKMYREKFSGQVV
ncbi:helix-turn-helix domain-containing protein [Flavobacterium salilacus subsp. salilacus]|uniref:GlxA family transcriptional regulator n=1 Tax=Flavobacterium TaxID=237 RepID=UPI001074D396|nr:MULTISPECIES: helix-turn-helix domain-containing protein [Flavobacterium]KAF2519898.1 helix-turn-helix domain-containing protein [Flavobacterium salilacus subsp. salilacus]MBE1614195.1 helix-turn-helix domain-containing protein [Flavobacterium sp. SaA2.13]